jgi:hypothetical protein
MSEYEYGIGCVHYSFQTTDAVHRFGLTKEDAIQWLKEWVDDGGNPSTFFIIRRPVTKWEVLNE